MWNADSNKYRRNETSIFGIWSAVGTTIFKALELRSGLTFLSSGWNIGATRRDRFQHEITTMKTLQNCVAMQCYRESFFLMCMSCHVSVEPPKSTFSSARWDVPAPGVAWGELHDVSGQAGPLLNDELAL